MKHIIITGLLLLAVLGLNILSVWYISTSAEKLDTHFPALQAAVAGNDWEQAHELWDALERQWQQYRPKWKALLNHEDLQAMELVFTDLQVLLQQKNQARAEQELARLRFFIRNLPESEKLSMENLL